MSEAQTVCTVFMLLYLLPSLVYSPIGEGETPEQGVASILAHCTDSGVCCLAVFLLRLLMLLLICCWKSFFLAQIVIQNVHKLKEVSHSAQVFSVTDGFHPLSKSLINSHSELLNGLTFDFLHGLQDMRLFLNGIHAVLCIVIFASGSQILR